MIWRKYQTDPAKLTVQQIMMLLKQDNPEASRDAMLESMLKDVLHAR